MKFWEVGEALKERRKEKGLSQEELAVAAGMSRVTLSKLESGKIADVSIAAFIRVLDSLGKEMEIVDPRPMPTLDDLTLGDKIEK